MEADRRLSVLQTSRTDPCSTMLAWGHTCLRTSPPLILLVPLAAKVHEWEQRHAAQLA